MILNSHGTIQSIPFSQLLHMVLSWDADWRYPSTNKIDWGRHKDDHVALPQSIFWSANYTLERITFKFQENILEYIFSRWILVNNVLTHLHSHSFAIKSRWVLLEKPILGTSVCSKFTFQGFKDYLDENMHLKIYKTHSIVNHVLLNLELRMKTYNDINSFKVILLCLFSWMTHLNWNRSILKNIRLRK